MLVTKPFVHIVTIEMGKQQWHISQNILSPFMFNRQKFTKFNTCETPFQHLMKEVHHYHKYSI